jgi:hypothetical protein
VALVVRLLIVIFLTVAAVGCGSHKGKTVQVSMAQLQVQPEKYVGARVIFSGYSQEEGGFLLLYPSAQHAAEFDQGSAIYIYDSSADKGLIKSSACHGSWFTVIGEFGLIPGLQLYGVVEAESVVGIRQKDDCRDGSAT